MPKGETSPAEWLSTADPETGVGIRQLTHHKGHSHHLYFTNPGWYEGGRKLLFGSDRNNRTNLFGVDLESGEITQLTDLDQPPPPAETSFLFASVNPTREEAYFWHGRDLLALDLGSLEERKLFEAPEGFMTNMTNVTADGRYVCVLVFEDLSERFGVDLLHGYIGFEEYWAARPLSRIIKVNTGNAASATTFEEDYWIGHTNTSPTLPNLLTFCHEGPWHRVDNRIWGLDLDNGRAWKIRPGPEGEAVGHEYWLADGKRIGYHGYSRDGEHFFGSISHDNSGKVEAPFPHGSTHFHSNDLSLISATAAARNRGCCSGASATVASRDLGSCSRTGDRSTRKSCTPTPVSPPTEARSFTRATRAATATFTLWTHPTSTPCLRGETRERRAVQ